MIKLIAMDFDWTLMDHSKKIGKVERELIDKLNAFIKNGGYAGIVSGRLYWQFKAELEYDGVEWGHEFPNYIIAREAYIYEIKNTEYIGHSEYNSLAKKRIMNLNVILGAYIADIFKLCEARKIEITDFYIYGDFAVEIHVNEKQAEMAMSVIGEFVRKTGIKDAEVHRNGIMITIYHSSAGKGNTLLAFAESVGIKPEEVLAIGDNYNDLSMIDGKKGFIGGCVGNADENIKKIVKEGGGYIGSGNASKGILDILRQVKIN